MDEIEKNGGKLRGCPEASWTKQFEEWSANSGKRVCEVKQVASNYFDNMKRCANIYKCSAGQCVRGFKETGQNALDGASKCIKDLANVCHPGELFKENKECFEKKCDCQTLKSFYAQTNQLYLLPAAIADCMNIENSYKNMQSLYECANSFDSLLDKAGGLPRATFDKLKKEYEEKFVKNLEEMYSTFTTGNGEFAINPTPFLPFENKFGIKIENFKDIKVEFSNPIVEKAIDKVFDLVDECGVNVNEGAKAQVKKVAEAEQFKEEELKVSRRLVVRIR